MIMSFRMAMSYFSNLMCRVLLFTVIPAQAGIQQFTALLDPRLCEDDISTTQLLRKFAFPTSPLE